MGAAASSSDAPSAASAAALSSSARVVLAEYGVASEAEQSSLLAKLDESLVLAGVARSKHVGFLLDLAAMLHPADNKQRARHHSAIDVSEFPSELAAFRPLRESEAVVAVLRDSGASIASWEEGLARGETLAAAAESKARTVMEELSAAYDDAVDAALRKLRAKKEGVIAPCLDVIDAGNKLFCDIYNQVWHLSEETEAVGIARYAAAVAALRDQGGAALCDSRKQRTGDVVDLYADAARTKPRFDTALRELAASVEVKRVIKLELPNVLKSSARVVEKAALRKDYPGDASGVCDVVRAMVVAKGMNDIAVVLEAIARRKDIVVCRIKERFLEAPTDGGWRDAMLNFTLAGDAAEHVCEVQVVHARMLTARSGLPGHAVYNRVRNAAELVEKAFNWRYIAMLRLWRAQHWQCVGDDLLTWEHLEKVGEAQGGGHLLKLNLKDKPLSVSDAARFVACDLPREVVEIDLSCNSIGDEGAKAIGVALEKNGALQTLTLENNSIGDEGAKVIGVALEKNGVLQTLNLKYNSIGDEGAKAIGVALEKNGALQTLTLENNSIGDEGAKVIGVALEKNGALQTLNLQSNSIRRDGVQVIAKALRRNTTIQFVNMENTYLGNEEIVIVEPRLQLPPWKLCVKRQNCTRHGDHAKHWTEGCDKMGYLDTAGFCSVCCQGYDHGVEIYCYEPRTPILMADGATQRADKLKKNDIVQTHAGPAAVAAVYQYPCGPHSEMVHLNGFWITPTHPVFDVERGVWAKPADFGRPSSDHGIQEVYAVELFGHADTIVVNGICVVALGRYCGPAFGFNIFTRKSVRCDDVSCPQCDATFDASVDHGIKVTSKMLARRYSPFEDLCLGPEHGSVVPLCQPLGEHPNSYCTHTSDRRIVNSRTRTAGSVYKLA